MKTTISDKIYITNLPPLHMAKIKTQLTRNNPAYWQAVTFGRSTASIPRTITLYWEIFGGIAVPRGIKLDSLLTACNADIHGLVINDQTHTHPVSIVSNIKPRPYQEDAIQKAIAAGGGVIVAPTGSGKTTMGIELAARLKQRCLILVKSLDLAKQWQGAIKQFTGLDCGLIGGGKFKEGQEFTVALVQTLVKELISLDYGMVIVDECHNAPCAQSYAVINAQCARYRFGLSATPQRRDNLEFMLHAALGDVVARIEAEDVLGAVLPVQIVTHRYPLQGDPQSWTEFNASLAGNHDRNQFLTSISIKASRKTGTVILTSTIDHAERLGVIASTYGAVNALVLHGQLTPKERTERMLKAPDSPLIIGTLSLLSEGIDWPHVGAIVFASPVSASIDKDKAVANRLIQSIGRARRPYPGKNAAFIFDVIDVHPFGLAAWKKRKTIYQQQGFNVRKFEQVAV